MLPFFLGPVFGQEKQPEPGTPEQAAEQVLAAWEAGESSGVASQARESEPDPWLVAEVLCRRGRREAAIAFARAVPHLYRSRLLTWVKSVEVSAEHTAFAERLAAALRAVAADDREAVLRLLPGSEAGDGPLVVRIEELRATMLLAGKDVSGAGEALARSGAAARAVGWLEQAATDWRRAGLCSYSETDFESAAAHWRKWLAVAEELGDPKGLAEVLNNLGVATMKLSCYDEAMRCYERSMDLAKRRGDRLTQAKLEGNMGIVHRRRGDLPAARAAQERSLALAEAIGNEKSIAAALTNLGGVHVDAGRYEEALEILDRALALKTKLRDERGVATVLLNLAICHQDLGNLPEAREALTRSIGLANRLDLPDVEARARVNLGNVALIAGNHLAARGEQERALLLARRIRDRSIEARALGNLARIHRTRGDFQAAIRLQEQAMAVFKEIGERRAVARTLMNLGTLYLRLGDHERSSDYDLAAMEIMRDLEDHKGLAHAWHSYGAGQLGLGNLDAAEAAFARASGLREKIEGDQDFVAALLSNQGMLLRKRGRLAEAEVLYRQVLALELKSGELIEEARSRLNLAAVLYERKKVAAAREQAERVLDTARELALPELEVRGRVILATCLREQNLLEDALRHARLAIERSRLLTAGLAEEQKARYRESQLNRFQLGIEIAVARNSPEEAWYFLESGRAAGLIETLELREALTPDLLSEDLARAYAAARAEMHGASLAHRRALARGIRRDLAEARSRVSKAEDAWIQIQERMERELQAGARVLTEEPAPLESVQSALRAGDTLVLYTLMSAEAAALVVTKKTARIVRLGEVEAIRALGDLSCWRDPGEDNPVRGNTLRKLLIEPLRLADDTKRILISPDGELAYVPFTLATGDLPVVMVPSGSALLALGKMESTRGVGVLALGDPEYDDAPAGEPASALRGPRLAPLPESGAEARAVGSTVLLGKKATVKGMRDGLAGQKRWRALHLACHGIVDPERPMLSALVLTPGADDDGFLRCLDLFRMTIPADLVVLSACDTARGRVYQAEGVVGLTRAFMTAGSPRVLCSLWKVDDKSTKALMVKFYELWNPPEGEGLSAAQALLVAQRHVRSHEEWKHPFYWAAWVLWGVPD